MTLRIGFDPTQCAFAHGLGSPLPGVASPSIALIYSSRTASHIIIYSSKPHRTYVFQQNSIANIYFTVNIYFSRIASPVYTTVNIYFSRIASPVYTTEEQH